MRLVSRFLYTIRKSLSTKQECLSETMVEGVSEDNPSNLDDSDILPAVNDGASHRPHSTTRGWVGNFRSRLRTTVGSATHPLSLSPRWRFGSTFLGGRVATRPPHTHGSPKVVRRRGGVVGNCPIEGGRAAFDTSIWGATDLALPNHSVVSVRDTAYAIHARLSAYGRRTGFSRCSKIARFTLRGIR